MRLVKKKSLKQKISTFINIEIQVDKFENKLGGRGWKKCFDFPAIIYVDENFNFDFIIDADFRISHFQLILDDVLTE